MKPFTQIWPILFIILITFHSALVKEIRLRRAAENEETNEDGTAALEGEGGDGGQSRGAENGGQSMNIDQESNTDNNYNRPENGRPEEGTHHINGNPQYGSENPQHGNENPQNGYGNPQNGHGNPQNGHGNPQNGYENPQNGNENPQNGHGNPQNGNGNPSEYPQENPHIPANQDPENPGNVQTTIFYNQPEGRYPQTTRTTPRITKTTTKWSFITTPKFRTTRKFIDRKAWNRQTLLSAGEFIASNKHNNFVLSRILE